MGIQLHRQIVNQTIRTMEELLPKEKVNTDDMKILIKLLMQNIRMLVQMELIKHMIRRTKKHLGSHQVMETIKTENLCLKIHNMVET